MHPIRKGRHFENMAEKQRNETYIRCSVTFPPELLERIDKRAYELGLNRSGFLSYCVNKQFEFDEMMKQLPQLMVMAQTEQNIREKKPSK